MSEHREGDRIVVRGRTEGNHFPRTQAELEFAWSAVGSSGEGPFAVPGSIYGRDLEFDGPGSVGGPVLSRGDITLRNGGAAGGASQAFFCGLAATGGIAMEGPRPSLQDGLAGDLGRADLVIRGDVMASSISLRNAVVFGNIEAPRIELEQCLVLGAAIASERLAVRASTFLHYHAGEVGFEGPCVAIAAMGESRTRPVFSAYENADGVLWPSSVRFYPALRAYLGRGLVRRPWAHEDEMERRADLHPGVDWVRVEASVPTTRAVEGTLQRVEDLQERYVLTIGGRCLDFRGAEAALRSVAALLRTGHEWDHYDQENREASRRSWPELFTEEEQRLMAMVTGEDRA